MVSYTLTCYEIKNDKQVLTVLGDEESGTDIAGLLAMGLCCLLQNFCF